MKYRIILIFLVTIQTFFSSAQNKKPVYLTISGTVYDVSARTPIESVMVYSTSGHSTFTDSTGRYSFTVVSTDSIWFKMLNKSTMKFPIDTIKNTSQFDIMIHVRSVELPEVKVKTKNYRLDSIENRKDYAKYFNYHKPTLKLSTDHNYNPGSVGAGFDLDEIINMFRFKRNRSLEALQKRLLLQEQDHYVDHRFSKNFVIKLTKLKEPQLDDFMNKYRPDYELLKLLNDIELGYYIEKCFDQYKYQNKKP